MKRSKFLALVLVVAVMMMGAGYAYWQETLTITNTVTTGQLDFTFQNARVIEVDEYMNYDGTSSCQVGTDNNQVDIVLEDMYPGAEATVAFDLLNSGTMKAKLKNFAVNDFDGKAFFNVKSLKIGGVEKLAAPIKLANLAASLDAQKIAIEPQVHTSFEITFEIDPAAGNNDIAEKGTYNFSLTADGLQYNDNVN